MGVRTVTGSRPPRQSWRERAMRAAHRRGWEVRHVDPFVRLEDYLSGVLLPFLAVDCVFDVGAHVGEYATSLRRAGYSGDIVSFEPVSGSFRELKERAAPDPRWHVHQTALGDTDEIREINVTATTTFSSLRSPRHDHVAEFAVSRDQFQRLVEFDCVMLRVSALARRERADGCERERGGRQDLVSGRA